MSIRLWGKSLTVLRFSIMVFQRASEVVMFCGNPIEYATMAIASSGSLRERARPGIGLSMPGISPSLELLSLIRCGAMLDKGIGLFQTVGARLLFDEALVAHKTVAMACILRCSAGSCVSSSSTLMASHRLRVKQPRSLPSGCNDPERLDAAAISNAA
jgi:hypothetical protein